jgi:hypothetical protein
MSARRVALLALALGLADRHADAAPMGIGVEAVGVLSLEADRDSDLAAKTLTNVLRQIVLDAPEYTLRNENVSLLLTAIDLKCPLGGGGMLPDERAFDEACLRKVSKALGMRRFFWGYVTAGTGGASVRLHFWQLGQGDHAVTLPYEPSARERVAERLYRKLVTPEKVSDVTVDGAFLGELVVNGKPQGAYAPGAELTLPVGEHEVEVRQGPRVVARGRARVAVGGASARVTLEAVAAPVTAAPSGPVNEPPRVTIRPQASAWPWVLGGTAAVGLAGAGALWALRSNAKGDAEGQCVGNVCPDSQRDAVERADRYGTFSAVSLGIGLASGAGLAAYLLTAKRAPSFVGTFAPLVGGAAASVGGRF